MFYLLMPSLEQRSRLIQYLKDRGILAVFHYVPLHLSEMGLRFGDRSRACPITESVSNRLLRLPFYNDLAPDQQAEVIEAIRAFRC
jgi:dTDP-4-amino-4,6-dideoxygalactose transaminase